MAWKCGNCHRNRIPKSNHAPRSSLPVAATHPIIGGIAPGNAPTNVAHTVRFFSGVYASKKLKHLATPNPPPNPPPPENKNKPPATHQTTPHTTPHPRLRPPLP